MREMGITLDGGTNVVAMQDVHIGCCRTVALLKMRSMRWGLTGAAVAFDGGLTGAVAALPAAPPLVAILLGAGNAAVAILVLCAIGMSQP